MLNNPITRGFFDFPILPHGTPYDQTVAKYLVKLLNYEPGKQEQHSCPAGKPLRTIIKYLIDALCLLQTLLSEL